jgi:hypothetical protein
MLNEFEKQVQQKIEELKLVPSEPVWQKVEMQIRKKKDRRRLVLWIPFLVFLLGGSLWIGIDHYSNQVAYNKNSSKTEKNNNKTRDLNLPTTPTTTTAAKDFNKKSSESIKATKNNSTLQNKKIKLGTKPKEVSVGLSSGPNVQNNFFKKIGETIEKTLKGKKETSVKPEEAGLNHITTNEVIVSQSSIEKILKESVPNLAIQVRTDTANAIFLKKKIEPSVSIAGSIKKDSASVKDSIQIQDTAAVKKTQVKKYATSKWKLNLVAAVGSSNLARLNLFSGLFGGEKSLVAPNYSGGPGTSAGGSVYYGPSPIKEGLSFSVGAIAKKQLARRTFFSTGLGYNYYSNTIQVGNRINQNRVLMDFAVSQYYSNTATSLQPYRNQYHFISLPAAIDWQLLKKLPLNFHTGLSLQYMVQTNGLVFDYSTQSYFNSKDAFNRVQLFFEPALTYSVTLKQKLLTFGPQMQYGFSSLEKNNSNHHISSYGLKVQLQLNKK